MCKKNSFGHKITSWNIKVTKNIGRFEIKLWTYGVEALLCLHHSHSSNWNFVLQKQMCVPGTNEIKHKGIMCI